MITRVQDETPVTSPQGPLLEDWYNFQEETRQQIRLGMLHSSQIGLVKRGRGVWDETPGVELVKEVTRVRTTR